MKTTIGSFTLILNEARFIRKHLESWLPLLDSMVFYDGGSQDGTLTILREFANKSDKVKLFENKDPKNLEDDYVRLFNESMGHLSTDLGIFLHPDMIPDETRPMAWNLPKDFIAGTMNIRSFAGNPGDKIYEIEGRGKKWKNIYRMRNPDLGAHYFGHYGAQNEDIYFREITGDGHEHYNQNFDRYPYPVIDSGITVCHYSDVRTPERRLDRMVKCLVNQGFTLDEAKKIGPNHPRVSLKSDRDFTFKEIETPDFLKSEVLA